MNESQIKANDEDYPGYDEMREALRLTRAAEAHHATCPDCCQRENLCGGCGTWLELSTAAHSLREAALKLAEEGK